MELRPRRAISQTSHFVSIWKLAICAGLIITVFWRGLFGGFIFDDFSNFVDVPSLHIHDWNWSTWHGVWISAQQSNVGRPLAIFSFALNYMFENGPFGFKATNLGIHLLNTVLLAALASRILRAGWPHRDGEDAYAHAKRTNAWALALTVAWALHPLQISTVMYVVQRMELLGFTFTLLGLLTYWHARQQQLSGNRGWPWLALSVMWMLAGYSAKETVVLIPGYALLLEMTLLDFQGRNSKARVYWKIFYAIGVLFAALAFAFYFLPHYANEQAYAVRDFTPWQRELTQLRVLCMYLAWCIFPLPSQLHFYYDDYVISSGWLQPPSTFISAIILSSLLAFAVMVRRRRPLLALGIGWFFVAHSLTSSPIGLEMVFEHRNYPALFGILLAIVDLIRWTTLRAHPRLPVFLGSIFIATLGLFSMLRASTWGNPVQLALTLTEENPRSARASYDLANLYMHLSGGDQHSPFFGKMITEFERTTTLPNSSPLPEQALLLLAAKGQIPLREEWWTSLLYKLQTHPFGPQEANALTALLNARINGDAKLDDQHLQQACELALKQLPWSIALYKNYAELASRSLHDPQLAIEQWKQVLILSYGDPDYPTQVVEYLVGKNRLVEAKGVARIAEEMEPELRENTHWQALDEKLYPRAAPSPTK